MAAAEGVATATVAAETALPVTTVKLLESMGVGSEVVATLTWCWPGAGLVTPSKVVRMRAPAATVAVLLMKHSIASPTGLKQPPTSVVPTNTLRRRRR